MSLLDDLNPQQREAVATTEGPLLVLAGAGSGKTRVLTYRIAHLLEQGLATPDDMLAVTFTNKAAGEVRDRVATLCGPRRFPFLGTFHSCGVRMLRAHADTLGIPRGFSIYDTSDQLVVVKEAAKELQIPEEAMPPRRALAIISRAKNKLESVEQFRKQAQGQGPEMECVAGIYRLYQQRLEANGAMDFDDLLTKVVEMFDAHAEILAEYQERFKYILVDEYQDVNFAQYVLIRRLSRKHGNLCVVGDDDQSIYGFRGADVSIILQFEKDFPNAKVVKLEQNYRSTRAVLDAANAVVANNPNRKEKTMWTSNAKGELPVVFEAAEGRTEARYMVRKVKEIARSGREYGEFAILYRTNAQSRVVEDALRNANVPYQLVGGTRFWDRKEIKDLVAYMRVVVNPDDDLSLERIINVPPRGIGTVTMGRLRQHAARNRTSLYGVLKVIDTLGDITPKILSAISEVRGLVDDMEKRRQTQSVKDLVERIIRVTGYKDWLAEDRSPEGQSRLENVAELINTAAEFEREAEREGEPATLENFLSRSALVSDQDTLEGEGGSVTLMTLHSAKGLEFPVVFLCGLEEGLFPHARVFDNPKELEEERRLCYVGMTRARETLYLTRARVRDVYGVEQSRVASRFLGEIPDEMVKTEDGDYGWLEHEERPTWQQRPSYGGGTAYGAGRAPTHAPPPTVGRGSAPGRSGPVTTTRPATTTRGATPSTFTPSRPRPTAEPVRPAPAPSMFKAGQSVVHKVFGEGKVSKVEGRTVTADFPGYGEKTVVETFLTPVRSG